MTTIEELQQFAQKNNLRIHPARDINGIVEQLNANGGACLCDGGRKCPCEQAITECMNVDPKNQTCLCRVFVTNNYLAAWGHIQGDSSAPKKTQKKQKEAETKSKTKQTSDQIYKYVAKNKELDEHLKALAEARKKLDLVELDQAEKILKNDTDKASCIECKKKLQAETDRFKFLKSICSLKETEFDVARCKKEIENAKSSIDDLAVLFIKADGGDIKGEDVEEEKKTYRSDYHACMSQALKSEELKDYPQKEKFSMAQKMCSNKGD